VSDLNWPLLPCLLLLLCHLPCLYAALLHHNATDVRVPFAAAAAIAAYISVYLLSSQSSWGGGSSSNSTQGQLLGVQWGQQLAVPPMGLVSPDKLTALLRLFKYRFGGSGPPMNELLEGVPCRWAW
jgi:hypothetical protein